MPATQPFTVTTDSDGYIDGQRDRALVLDFLVQQHKAGRYDFVGSLTHPVTKLDLSEMAAARDALLADKLAYRTFDRGPVTVSPAGLAVHAAAQRALAALDAKIAALPPAATTPAPVAGSRVI